MRGYRISGMALAALCFVSLVSFAVSSPAVSIDHPDDLWKLHEAHSAGDFISFRGERIDMSRDTIEKLSSSRVTSEPVFHTHSFKQPSSSPSSFSSLNTAVRGENALEQAERNRHFMVHIKAPVSTNRINAINAEIFPLSLGSYIPHNTYLVTHPVHDSTMALSDSEVEDILRSAPYVMAVLEYHPSHKLSIGLRSMFAQKKPQDYLSSLYRSFQPSLSSSSASSSPSSSSSSSPPSSSASKKWGLHLDHENGEHALYAEDVEQEHEGRLKLIVTVYSEHADLVIPQLISKLTSEFERAGMSIEMKQTSEYRFSLLAPLCCVQKVAEHLSEHREVQSIQEKRTFRTHNKYGHFVVQDGFRSNTTRMWSNGLTGEGEVVAISDTGIDYDSCFFSDPDVELQPGHVTNHRKFVSYTVFQHAGAGDEEEGHGTHTSGTLAGHIDTTTPISQFNGMAYKAKLAFYDMARNGKDDLYVPDDFKKDFLIDSYNQGARVSSNSWGSPNGDYDIYCSDTDKAMYEKQDFLVVYAAGNYGSDEGYFSLTTPGVSKNALTVGSSKNSRESFIELGYGLGLRTSTNSLITLRPAAFGTPWLDSSFMDVKVVKANPYDACSDLTNTPSEIRGYIVLTLRGTCSFAVKARNIEKAGGIAMLLHDNHSTSTSVGMAGDGNNNINIPAASIVSSDGLRLQVLMQQDNCFISGPVVTAEANSLNPNYLSSFSSRGPTPDGRLKPDIVAPGEELKSVKSDGSLSSNNCPISSTGLLSMMGTSMATPLTAGTAVLLRQYLTQGWYPSGRPTPSDSIEYVPSSLLKAILMNSGQNVGGSVKTKSHSVHVEPVPSIFQGYGRISLASVLPFAKDLLPEGAQNYHNEGYNLFLDYNHEPLQTGDKVSHCIEVTEASSLKASLSWVDPPPEDDADFLLVNDLDLSIQAVDGNSTWLGNNLRDSKGSEPMWDVMNNAEQVWIGQLQPGKFVINVKATRVGYKGVGQPYSLALSGYFTSLPLSECTNSLSICPSDCNHSLQKGQCNTKTGVCECLGNFYGPTCSQEASTLIGMYRYEMDDKNQSSHWIEYTKKDILDSETWDYQVIEVKERDLQQAKDPYMIIEFDRNSQSGDPDLYISYNEWPDMINSEWSSAYCEGCNQKNKQIVITGERLKAGKYHLGIHAFCCVSTMYTMSIKLYLSHSGSSPTDTEHKPITPSDEPSFVLSSSMWLIAIGGVVILIGLYIWYRKRSTNSTYMPVHTPVVVQQSYAGSVPLSNTVQTNGTQVEMDEL